MIAKLLSGLGLCCVLWPAVAAEQNKPQAAYLLPKAVNSVLTDIIPVAEQFYMAAGERGHLLKSKDGVQWQQVPVPLNSNLTSVYFADAKHGWAVGHDASILHSNDGGESWQIQQYLPLLDKPLFDVVFLDQKQGIAVGAYGMFYRTTDGGQHWNTEFHPELASIDDQALLAELKASDPDAYAAEVESVLPHFNRLFRDGQTLYMVGEAGFVAVSHDFGVNWQRLPEFYNGSLFAIARTPAKTLVVAGLRGHLFRSTDQGQQWQQIQLPSPATLNSVFVAPDGALYATGNGGTLLVSRDDGQSFTAIALKEGKAVMQMVAIGAQLVLATEAGIKTIQLEEKTQP
jgi:photosystem II stability/assembly factor-like uncharacterized protein